MNELHEKAKLNQGVSTILPALNEEDNLEALVTEIMDYFNTKHIPYEIIIIDDGSSDGTRTTAGTLASQYKTVSVIHHKQNKGYGNSLKDGFRASAYKYLFFTDADKQFRINSLDRFLPLMKEGNVDMVIGYRIDRKDTPLRKFLAWCFNKIVSMLFSLNYKDIDCAFKLFKREVFESLEVKADDFLFNAELLAKAQLKNFRIVQIGVDHYPRLKGKSTISYKFIPLTIKKLFSLCREVKDFKKKVSSKKLSTKNLYETSPTNGRS